MKSPRGNNRCGEKTDSSRDVLNGTQGMSLPFGTHATPEPSAASPYVSNVRPLCVPSLPSRADVPPLCIRPLPARADVPPPCVLKNRTHPLLKKGKKTHLLTPFPQEGAKWHWDGTQQMTDGEAADWQGLTNRFCPLWRKASPLQKNMGRIGKFLPTGLAFPLPESSLKEYGQKNI